MNAPVATPVETAQATWEKAAKELSNAGEHLAYDLTFRAEDEYQGQHDRPSAELTARLKARYRAAHEVERLAFAALQACSVNERG